MPHTRKRCQSLSVQGSMIPMYPPPPIYGLTHCVYQLYPPRDWHIVCTWYIPLPGGLTYCVYLIYPPPPRGTNPLSLPDISPPWFLRHVGVSPVSVESGSIEISLGQLIPAREHEQIICAFKSSLMKSVITSKWYLSKFKKCSSNI